MVLLPELSELLALRSAAHGLALQRGRPAAAPRQGGHRSSHRGRGLEFEEVRAYAPGDDARHIDWRVTARRGRPHTKLFREERERPVWLLADLHPGLFFGSRRQLKSALLLRVAAILAWSVIEAGDRLGAVIAGGQGRPRVMPPRAREGGALALLQALVEAQPRAPGPAGPGSLAGGLAALGPVVRPGSLVLVLSDFTDTGEAVGNALAGLAVHAECRLLWFVDGLEREGLPAGLFRVGLPGAVRSIDGQRSRAAWQAAWAQREQRLAELSRRLQMPLLRLETADDPTLTMPRILDAAR